MLEYSDIVNFTREELLEEYCKLSDKFQELRELGEADKQKIYDLKRSLDTAIVAQAYLSQELEQYSTSNYDEVVNELRKVQTELAEMKKRYGMTESSLATLQQSYNSLLEENSKLSQKLIETLRDKELITYKEDTKLVDDYLERIQALENENIDLLQKIENFEERSVHFTLVGAESEKKIEILRDQIKCLEENLKSKRDDLDEKVQILESTQEQLAEANARIAVLSTAPNNNDRKGNSLFAEVDDQRQAMKQLLTTQKKTYMEMKKIYNERESEIRRLKRENISMHTELAACSAIFCNADKIYQEKLNERIHYLLNQNEDLESKVEWAQERLKELANDKGVLFLDSVLSFCKKETDDLKAQLHSVRIQKASLEEQLRIAQQDIARWRFESLKSRCILMDREHLLTENKITFKPIHAMEFSISKKDQEKARPRIVTHHNSNMHDNVIKRISTTPSKETIKQDKESPNQYLLKETSTSHVADNMKENEIINIDSTDTLTKNEGAISVMTTLADEIANTTKVKKIDSNESLIVSERKQDNNQDKENINCINANPKTYGFAKLKIKPISPMRLSQKTLKNLTLTTSAPPVRSILIKPNDLLFRDSCKNVKFSSNGDTVHNLSIDTATTTSTTTNLQSNTSTNTKIKSENTTEQIPIKSNVVVRRVIVSSKRD